MREAGAGDDPWGESGLLCGHAMLREAVRAEMKGERRIRRPKQGVGATPMPVGRDRPARVCHGCEIGRLKQRQVARHDKKLRCARLTNKIRGLHERGIEKWTRSLCERHCPLRLCEGQNFRGTAYDNNRPGIREFHRRREDVRIEFPRQFRACLCIHGRRQAALRLIERLDRDDDPHSNCQRNRSSELCRNSSRAVPSRRP